MDIFNSIEIEKRIINLQAESVAKYGKMTAQHMIEHLTLSVMFSNGTMPQKLAVSKEVAEKNKTYFIEQNNDFKPGFKIPLLGDEPPAYFFNDIKEAKKQLINSIQVLENYFSEYPGLYSVNPIMGMLSKEEWIIIHNKHFKHHFGQFGI